MPTLYAWAKPAIYDGFIWDHTWVTDYDNRAVSYSDISSVIAGGNRNWYCWGDYHNSGGTSIIQDGFIGGVPGSISYAECLCAPNLLSRHYWKARGTIFFYGVHGVCHQIANQVLEATRLRKTHP